MESQRMQEASALLPEERELWRTVEKLEAEFDMHARETISPGARPPTELDQDRLDEWKQYMFDLGYLDETPEQVHADVYTPPLLHAIEAFLREARPLFHSNVAEVLESEDDATWDIDGNTAPSPAARELLASLLSFDGDMPFTSQPRLGDRGLVARLLHYRLKTLGLFSGDVSAPVGDDTMRSLKLLVAWFGDHAIADLGDGVKLLERYLTRRRAEGREDGTLVIARDPDPPNDETEELGDLVYAEGEFRSGLWLFSKRLTDRERYHALKDEMASREEPRAWAERTINRAGLKLLQVVLWSRGLYVGRLDDWWGAVSHRGFMQALEMRDVRREDAVRRLPGGFLAINLPLIARELAPRAADEHEVLEIHTRVAIEESELFDVDAQDHSVLLAAWQGIKSGFRSALAAGRRLATGVKAMLRTSVDAFRRGFAWVRLQLGELHQAVVSVVRSSFREVREAVRMLARSIQPFVHFLLRKPLGTVDHTGQSMACTRFDVDRDTVAWVAPNSSPETVTVHAALCLRLARALELVLTFAGKVIFYLVRGVSGPAGWLRIGLRIAGIFRQTVMPRFVRAALA